jgi:predicted metal-dependent hydrolase
MSQKIVWLPEVGEVVLAKRKNAKNIRLSISAAGKVRASMPHWVPYAAGISFVKSRADWIIQNKESHKKSLLENSGRIGKSHRLNYVYDPTVKKTRTRINGQMLNIFSEQPFTSPVVQKSAGQIAERALKLEASKLLPQRLAKLASERGYKFRRVVIKKMVSRWGSCSSHSVIALNYFLMQLPWEMIDYVLIHELVHTKHLNHSPAFWDEFEKAYPGAKQARHQIKQFRPVINSIA